MTIILIGHHTIHTTHTDLGDRGDIGTDTFLILLIFPIHITVPYHGYDMITPKCVFIKYLIMN